MGEQQPVDRAGAPVQRDAVGQQAALVPGACRRLRHGVVGRACIQEDVAGPGFIQDRGKVQQAVICPGGGVSAVLNRGLLRIRFKLESLSRNIEVNEEAGE